MLPPDTTTPADETPVSSEPRKVIIELNFTGPAKPIAEFVTRPNFPACALGEFVDTGGYAGVIVAIVNNSIKVRSAEGGTQSFNFHRLRTLHTPAARLETAPTGRAWERPEAATVTTVTTVTTAALAVPAERVFIAEPDFTVPVQPIRKFAGRADFPTGAFGAHVDVAGFDGIVVEIVEESLKIRSAEGITRSYTAAALRKLYGRD